MTASTRSDVDPETGWVRTWTRDPDVEGEGVWSIISEQLHCEGCGDSFTPEAPSSARWPGYCHGCALDIDDPNTTPGGYSS